MWLRQNYIDTRYHVCAAPAYIDKYGMPDGPAALSDHQCLMFAIASYRGPWLFMDNH